MLRQSDLRERDNHLIENWYIACLSRELKKNEPLGRIVYDSPLVLFRDLKGEPVCFPDRCLHRHARLSEGDVFDGKLGCPYHGWTYNSDGLVVEIPSEGTNSCATQRNMCIQKYRCVEQDGCVWVWMGKSEPTSPLPTYRFPYSDNPQWAQYFMITDFQNEVTHLAENFMDVPHTVFVHKGWFRSQARKQIPIKVDVENGSVLITYKQSNDEIGFTGRILNPNNEPMSHTDKFMMPNITRVDYNFGSRNSFIINSQCTPVSTLQTRVYTFICYRLGLPTHLLKPFFRFYTRKVIEQDVDIMANQGSSFAMNPSLNFTSTDADEVHKAIEDLRERGARGDQSFTAVQKSMETIIWV